jgi:hypothetical protein
MGPRVATNAVTGRKLSKDQLWIAMREPAFYEERRMSMMPLKYLKDRCRMRQRRAVVEREVDHWMTISHSPYLTERPDRLGVHRYTRRVDGQTSQGRSANHGRCRWRRRWGQHRRCRLGGRINVGRQRTVLARGCTHVD